MLKAKTEGNSNHFIIALYFQKGEKAAETIKRICAVYREGTIAKSNVCKWLSSFQSGNFDVQDREVADDDQIERPVTNNPVHTTQCIAETLHIFHML